ncbi:MAG: hypothetical protein HZA19_06440 [Nitrospirae bacterium]|nr:hypothetical protein [Nitrospirota bacterium]
MRRFINGYWFVPLFTIYLELFAVLLPPWDSPLNTFYERNRSFVSGGVVLYHFATHEFPYTLIGHAQEIVIRKKHDWNMDQVSWEDVGQAARDPISAKALHDRLSASTQDHESEWGGVVSISHHPGGPHLHFYEIESMNKIYARELERVAGKPVSEFRAWLQDEDHQNFLKMMQIPETLVERLISVLASEKISDRNKESLRDGFIQTYRLYSESRYMLSPYDLKAFLGSGKMEGEYLGIFHFHNDLENPPSEADLMQSYRDRQIVITFERQGIRFYDVFKGVERPTSVPVS